MDLDLLKNIGAKAATDLELSKRGYAEQRSSRPKWIDGVAYRSDLEYEEWYPELAYSILSKGGGLCHVCRELKIGPTRLSTWRKKFDRFDQACEAGQAASVAIWQDKGEENILTKEFNAKVWDRILTERTGKEKPVTVIVNTDAATDCESLRSMVDALQKERI